MDKQLAGLAFLLTLVWVSAFALFCGTSPDGAGSISPGP